MNQLEIALAQNETSFITQVNAILSGDGSNRVKIALINRHYIRYLVKNDDLVRDAQLEPAQPMSVAA